MDHHLLRGRLTWKPLALGLAAALLIWQAANLVRPGQSTPLTDPDDFRSFYCAGRLALDGADPYVVEPLRTCEHEIAGDFGIRLAPGVVDPAPLPPYALAAIGLLGMLPFAIASALWFALMIASVALCVIALRRLTRLPSLAIAASVVFSLGFTAVKLGQFVALIAALLCASALLLRGGRVAGAALVASATMLEPHLGLPVVLALFIWKRQARLPLVAVAGVAVAVSFATFGPALCEEYLTRVLPLHALSEVDKLYLQYSATSLLWAAGLSPSSALRAGLGCYLCMVAAGVAFARRASESTGDDAFLVLVPPAFAVFGGSFIHLWQIAVAIPAGLLAFAHVPRWRPIVAVAVAILAFPPQTVLEVSGLVRPFNLALSATAPQAQWREAAAGQLLATAPLDDEPAEVAEMRNDRDGALARPHGAQLLGYAPKALTWFALVALFAALLAGLKKPPVSGRLGRFTLPVPSPARL